MYNNGRDTPLDVFPLGSSAVSPFSRPITSPSLSVTSSVSLPNSVYSFTDFEPTSPKVLGYLSDPIHVERTLHPSDKKIIFHQFNGKISRQNWFFPLVRRISSNTIPNISSTTIQILSGCHGDQNGNNGLWDINCGSRALFLEDKQIYEKLNGGCAEFTNGNNFLTDQISFKIYDVMEYFDRKEELKNEMKHSLSGEGQNHIVFAWCHSNHPDAKVREFMDFLKNDEKNHHGFPSKIYTHKKNPQTDLDKEQDGLRQMILEFRVPDLQLLLEYFGRNTSGKKSELQTRALNLVRMRPPKQLKATIWDIHTGPPYRILGMGSQVKLF